MSSGRCLLQCLGWWAVLTWCSGSGTHAAPGWICKCKLSCLGAADVPCYWDIWLLSGSHVKRLVRRITLSPAVCSADERLPTVTPLAAASEPLRPVQVAAKVVIGADGVRKVLPPRPLTAAEQIQHKIRVEQQQAKISKKTKKRGCWVWINTKTLEGALDPLWLAFSLCVSLAAVAAGIYTIVKSNTFQFQVHSWNDFTQVCRLQLVWYQCPDEAIHKWKGPVMPLHCTALHCMICSTEVRFRTVTQCSLHASLPMPLTTLE